MKNTWLRKVTTEDSDIIFAWINDPDTRRFSLNSEAIPRQDHDAWFAKRMADQYCYHYMVMNQDIPVGVVRLDLTEDGISSGEFRVSINIAPDERGKGYGKKALTLLVKQAACEIPDARILHAEIKMQNVSSVKGFEYAGFKRLYVTGGEDPVAYYELTINHSGIVYFRCDAGSVIGSGHLMRCLTIADACDAKGLLPVFVMASGDMARIVQQRGYVCVVLGTDYSQMYLEIPALSAVVPDGATIFLDSYQITDSYMDSLHAHDYHLIRMTDGERINSDVECLINYNLSANKKEYPTSMLRCLIGPDYAPVRPAFCDFPFGVTENICEIMITTGATDPYHISLALLQQILNSDSYKKVKLQVICGQYNTDLEVLKTLEKSYGDRVSIVTGETDLSSYMRRADFVFAGSGSTVYELCAIGVPSAVFSFADNQIPIAQAYGKIFPGMNLGDYRESGFEIAKRAIDALDSVSTLFTRQAMSRKMQELVDGRGAARIADAIYDVIFA
ncbi:MAG: UDP-2,4-diacetamido-2,4,6-trideoxy-beta-L-altropyranose hydrolase [Lachnospiraceae bacterium]|nr:UDP-2,4-diacetamido-2,4,6-trideoxy-beta-L-altropyranose hydrolase [Candidatus Merdinaster equi]